MQNNPLLDETFFGWIIRILRSEFHKQALCRLGFHDEFGPNGEKGNFCPWGCGKVLNPNAFQPWRVVLRDGTEYTVRAVNEHHAENLVVYGADGKKITSASFSAVRNKLYKVHPDNIASVSRITEPAQA